MFKMAGLVTLVAAASMSSGATAANGSLPDPATCVRYDQIVCSYQIVEEADLAGARVVNLSPVPGLPAPDRIELMRINGQILVYLYYPLREDLQGVAQ